MSRERRVQDVMRLHPATVTKVSETQTVLACSVVWWDTASRSKSRSGPVTVEQVNRGVWEMALWLSNDRPELIVIHSTTHVEVRR